MQTPIPAQLENWLKIVENKKSPQDLRQNAILHLTEIRAIIDKSIGTRQVYRYNNEEARSIKV